MVFYKDGVEVRVGDIFWSTVSGTQYEWQIKSFSEDRVYWKSFTFDHDGWNHISDTKRWLLIRRSNEKPIKRQSGFGKFIRSIEDKND